MRPRLAIAFTTPMLLLSATLWAGGVNEGAYEVLENGAGKFKVEIQNCPVANANVESITMEDLLIDAREITTGTDWKYRTYGPGDAHYGSITMSARAPGGFPGELFELSQVCFPPGGGLRPSITVTVLRADGTDGRIYNFHDVLLVSYEAPDPEFPDPMETVVVKPTGFDCDSGSPDEPVLDPSRFLNGFGVTVGPSAEGFETGGDMMWEFAQGGAITKEKKSLRFVDPADETQSRLKGARFVGGVTLRGPLTAGRKALCQWITETVQGKEWKRNLTVTELTTRGKEKGFTYTDAFPTRYVFPNLSASGTGNLYEEITMKPIRLELT